MVEDLSHHQIETVIRVAGERISPESSRLRFITSVEAVVQQVLLRRGNISSTEICMIMERAVAQLDVNTSSSSPENGAVLSQVSVAAINLDPNQVYEKILEAAKDDQKGFPKEDVIYKGALSIDLNDETRWVLYRLGEDRYYSFKSRVEYPSAKKLIKEGEVMQVALTLGRQRYVIDGPHSTEGRSMMVLKRESLAVSADFGYTNPVAHNAAVNRRAVHLNNLGESRVRQNALLFTGLPEIFQDRDRAKWGFGFDGSIQGKKRFLSRLETYLQARLDAVTALPTFTQT